MNWEPFITCAVTGSGETTHKSPHVPVTPEQIANSCIAAAKAGAAVVHIHVREPETGKGSRNVGYYAEVVERVRDADVDVVEVEEVVHEPASGICTCPDCGGALRRLGVDHLAVQHLTTAEYCAKTADKLSAGRHGRSSPVFDL